VKELTHIWKLLNGHESTITVQQVDEETIVEMHEFLTAFIREHNELYLQILRFEPIDLEVIHGEFVRRSGIRCSQKLFASFLDAKAINFISNEK
jgi:hypothetical protein